MLPILLVTQIIAASPVFSQSDSTRTKVLILDFVPIELSPSIARVVSDRFRKEMVKTGKFKVIPVDSLRARLGETGLDYLDGCLKISCLQQISAIMGSRLIFIGKIFEVEGVYTVKVSQFDVREKKIVTYFEEYTDQSLYYLVNISVSNLVYKIYTAKKSDYIELGGEESFAWLKVASIPPGAEVFLADRFVGRTPITLTEIPEGTYPLSLRLFSYDDITDTISVRNFLDTSYTYQFYGMAELRLFGSPLGAVVFINDDSIGTLPVTRKLREGSYNLRVEKEKFLPFQKILTVVREEEFTIGVNLTPLQKPVKAALWRSLVFPGFGQFYYDKNKKGFFWAVTEAGVIGALYLVNDKFKTSLDGYNRADADYLATRISLEERNEKRDEVNRWNSIRWNVAGVALGIWVVNMMDVLLFPPQIKLEKNPASRVDIQAVAPHPASVGLRWCWLFN